ncbi:MAG: hypothetical protein ACTJHU_11485 [Mycetocola sp.]
MTQHRLQRYTAAAVTGAAAVISVGLLIGCAGTGTGTGNPSDAGHGAPEQAASTPGAMAPSDADFASEQLPAPGATRPAEDCAGGDAATAELSGATVALLLPEEPTADEQAIADGIRSVLADARVQTMSQPGQGAPADEVIIAAAEERPAVIVVVGEHQLDAIDRVAASRLEQRFLILGAQLPEPTENVTAVIWPGGDGRGMAAASEPAPDTTALDPAAADSAVQTGLCAAVGDGSGFVYAVGE